MPFDYTIIPEQQLVEVRFRGAVQVNDLAEARARVTGDPAHQPGFALLIDMRDADLSVMAGENLRRRAGSPPTARAMAILVSTDLGYGMARMYELASAGRVAVFRSYEEAVAWLVPPAASDESD